VGHLLECAGQLTGGYFADACRKQNRLHRGPLESLWVRPSRQKSPISSAATLHSKARPSRS
jgi:hypothetical protein